MDLIHMIIIPLIWLLGAYLTAKIDMAQEFNKNDKDTLLYYIEAILYWPTVLGAIVLTYILTKNMK